MSRFRLICAILFVAATPAAPTRADVAIWTGTTSWIDQASANAQAQICADRLEAVGISVVQFPNAADGDLLRDWVELRTDDGVLDFLILFGSFPEAIYPAANAMPDGSVAELFIESPDGDGIINHADWMFYVSSGANNGAAGLQNMMDIPGITMAGNNDAPMVVTAEGRDIAPNLRDFLTDRPLHLSGLAGEWVVEAALAQSADGTLADPVIVRDGDRGRVIPILQANAQPDPKGAVAAEVITWLLDEPIEPTQLSLAGFATTVAGTPAKLTVSVQDDAGVPAGNQDATVVLTTDSATGAFDTVRDGNYDGTMTSVTVPAGRTATVYYRDSSVGTVTLSASTSGTPDVTNAQLELNVLEDLSGEPGEVVIWTGTTNWITKPGADEQAQICRDKLDLLDIPNEWLEDPLDAETLAEWMTEATDNGAMDVLILYGHFPSSIYPAGNAMPDDSIAELFIESTDGDVIINHADWMFYVSSANNGTAGLQNMMDIPGVTMAGNDNLQMTVTDLGKAVAPSLVDFLTDRPLHLSTLEGEWFVEAALAANIDGTLADPVVVRDGNRGRLIPMLQANAQNDPKGAVAAETIAWLYGIDLGDPTRLAVYGRLETAYPGQALRLTAEIQDFAGSPSVVSASVDVSLQTSSATGTFDITANGAFDGTVTSVTVAAGTSSVEFYYKDSTVGTPVVTASAAGLADGPLQVTILQKTYATPGEVAIWSGSTSWVVKATADAQAQICAGRLDSAGISSLWFSDPLDDIALAEWMSDSTDNGQLDVLILFGRFPPSIYPGGNGMPDGSIAELFIESTDGDAIINHGDWMFYVSSPNNGAAGLQNMMDIVGVTMAGNDNTPMVVTQRGMEIAPSLVNFATDRPLHLETLGGEWLVEEVLAQNADGTLADPVIVRDLDRGRVIPILQANAQNDPMGAVAAEVITFLYDAEIEATQIGISGPGTIVTDTSVQFRIGVEDEGGVSSPSATAVTVNLVTDSATGAFDTDWDGSFDGSLTSVTIPAGAAGETFVNLYYRDSAAGTVTLSAAPQGAPGLMAGELQVDVQEDLSRQAGGVAIWTGTVNWIGKAEADAQAQICVDLLADAGISAEWFADPAEEGELADWVSAATANGEVDALILYGYYPSALYPAGNAMPDGSIAELFIESTDGDVIINHADWMFYVSSTNNGTAGLQNMMDLPMVTMAGNNNLPVTVTPQGAAIAPSLTDFLTDRPLHLETLGGEWFVEASLAANADGTLAEPAIVRDGNRGRVIPVYQTNVQDDPKGAVAAEIIEWLMSSDDGGGVGPFSRGDCNSDNNVNLADAVCILNWLFSGAGTPGCIATTDTNGDGAPNITDATYLLNSLFSGGPVPVEPYPDCGLGRLPTDAELGCVSPPCQ